MDRKDGDIPIGEMTVDRLKTELRKRGAKVKGRKADLIERYV